MPRLARPGARNQPSLRKDDRFPRHRGPGSALVGLAVLGLSLFLLGSVVAQGPPPAPEPEMRQFYQDFRGGQPLHPLLKLRGPDAREVSKFEAEGLRITLPARRPVNHPVEVVAAITLSGDFDVTGTYELFSATQPDKGYGVGVGLNIADSNERHKFAKVSRCMLARGGSVNLSEYWSHAPRKDYQTRAKPSQARGGQLRLVRKGSALRCLAADGPQGDFQEIFSVPHFGTEDMAYLHFAVVDSGRPGNAVDARLLDLKVRATKLIPDPGTPNAQPVPAAAPAPASEPERPHGSMKWLVAVAIMGLLTLLALGAVLLVRRRQPAPSLTPAPAADGETGAKTAGSALSVPCSSCAKTLKVRAELAGKKIRCPRCGQATVVPSIQAARSDDADD